MGYNLAEPKISDLQKVKKGTVLGGRSLPDGIDIHKQGQSLLLAIFSMCLPCAIIS